MDEQEISGRLRLLATDRPDLGAVLRGVRDREAARSKRRARLAMAAAAGSVVVIVGGIGLVGSGGPDESPRIPPGSGTTGRQGQVTVSFATTAGSAASSSTSLVASEPASLGPPLASVATPTVASTSATAGSTATGSSATAGSTVTGSSATAGSSAGSSLGETP